jgi:hypothetical protein
MSRLKVALASVCLLVSARAAFADVIYSNFVANNGYDTNTSNYFSVMNSGYNQNFSSNTTLAVPFTVPPGINYRVTEIDVVASVSDIHRFLSMTIVTTPREGGSIYQSTTGALKTTPGYVQILPNGIKQTLLGGAQYYLEINVDTDPPQLSTARWYKNRAGVAGTVLFNDPSAGDVEYHPVFTNTQYPVFRILGTPVPAPAIKPAYSAFGTTNPSNVPVDATIFAEVVCPPDIARFTCPVTIRLASGATPAQICEQMAATVNAHQYGCWGSVDPASFHAACDGDNVRVTNSTTGLCAGAFVCIDHLDNLAVFASKRSLSYEYDSIEGPLQLQMRGNVSGLVADPAYSDEIQVDYRGLSSGKAFQVTVPLLVGTSPQKIAFSLEEALEEGIEEGVVATRDGLYFAPSEPYDLAVKFNDTTLDWALSPFPDLLARSDNNPAPTRQGTCDAGSMRLCLHQSRFQVETTWHTSTGGTGIGIAGPITDDTGYFWFFDKNNLEVFVKVLDACAFVDRFWVFASGLTDTGVEIKVTDTLTGQFRTYHSSLGAPFQPIEDTNAFATCRHQVIGG